MPLTFYNLMKILFSPYSKIMYVNFSTHMTSCFNTDENALFKSKMVFLGLKKSVLSHTNSESKKGFKILWY